MTARQQVILLLTSPLGDKTRKTLTVAQFRLLLRRMEDLDTLTEADLVRLGYDKEMTARMQRLLSEQDRLEGYLRLAAREGCRCIPLEDSAYPEVLTWRLGLDCPGSLWAKGDVQLLNQPGVALVGSRELAPENREFARQVGRQAARSGLVLISGNARGADREAQNACLEAGGKVVSVVADRLTDQKADRSILYLSEHGFDLGFSSQRALSRNRIIHSLGMKTFVAQSNVDKGGTWDGTIQNLRHGWSPVYCFRDGSEAAEIFQGRGAETILLSDIQQII